ncbi:hypothetical protein QL996_16365 [Planococcus sp. APC 4015]|nr:hypothetical protein [Planococcus sp. APC 4015]
MSAEDPSVDPVGPKDNRKRNIAWIVGGVVAAAAIVTAIAFAVMPRDATAEPGASASASADPSASASASATPGSTDPAASAAPEESTAPDANPFPELEPVAPQEPGEATGITASLVKFESVTGEVVGPGDVAAAAVRVTLDVTNTGSSPLDLNLVVMNAYMGAQRDPAETYEQPGGSPVNGSLAPGETATGVYLFRIPEDRRDDVTFVVDYYAGQPAITFRGPVP